MLVIANKIGGTTSLLMQYFPQEKRKELRKLTGSELESLNLYCFHLPSVYKNRSEDLRDAGILEVKDVGNELAKILNQYSPTLSERLTGFVLKGDQFGM